MDKINLQLDGFYEPRVEEAKMKGMKEGVKRFYLFYNGFWVAMYYGFDVWKGRIIWRPLVEHFKGDIEPITIVEELNNCVP